MNYFEPSLNLPTHKDFPTFQFGVYLDGVILDKMTGEIFYFYYEKNRIDQLKEIIKQPNISEKSYKTKIEFIRYTLSEEEHKQKVSLVLEEVKAGNTFQCQIGLKAEYKITGDTFPIYQELREVNPSPHMYYLKFGDKKIIEAGQKSRSSNTKGTLFNILAINQPAQALKNWGEVPTTTSGFFSKGATRIAIIMNDT